MSNQMNPWLASIYGTDGADDLEKTAQAHLLQKLAADQNLDISQLSPEEIEQMVQELAAEGYDVGALMQPAQQQPQPGMGMPQQPGMAGMSGGLPPQGQPQRPFAPAQQGGQPQMPQGMNPQMMQQGQSAGGAEAMQKEAQAKFEEADLLGRVMAHAYTDELEKIASHKKTAGRFGAAKESVKGAINSARNSAGHMAERAGSRMSSKATEVGMKARHHKGAIAAGAAGLAAGEVHGRMSKKASAFEKLAEEHAAEILSATGYDPASGQDLYGQQMLQEAQGQTQAPQAQQVQQPMAPQQGEVQPQEQAPVGGEQFTEALDNRALELLAENGYDVNEILARIQLAQNQPAQGQA